MNAPQSIPRLEINIVTSQFGNFFGLLMTARTLRPRLLSRFAGNFLRCRRDFPMFARTFVRSPEGCPARLRLVSLRRTEPSTARE